LATERLFKTIYLTLSKQSINGAIQLSNQIHLRTIPTAVVWDIRQLHYDLTSRGISSCTLSFR
jgi:hypothetical protein